MIKFTDDELEMIANLVAYFPEQYLPSKEKRRAPYMALKYKMQSHLDGRGLMIRDGRLYIDEHTT